MPETQKAMTPKQALSACIKIDPKRCYCVRRDDWDYSFDRSNRETNYSIVVLPGLSGDDCSRFGSSVSLAACVAEYRNAYEAAHAAE